MGDPTRNWKTFDDGMIGIGRQSSPSSRVLNHGVLYGRLRKPFCGRVCGKFEMTPMKEAKTDSFAMCLGDRELNSTVPQRRCVHEVHGDPPFVCGIGGTALIEEFSNVFHRSPRP